MRGLLSPFETAPYFDDLSSPFESPLSRAVWCMTDVHPIDVVGAQVHTTQHSGLWERAR